MGQFSIFSVCWLSLDIKVHTLIAKSCSFGNGDISDIIKRSYSVDLYKSVDSLWIIRRPSVMQTFDHYYLNRIKSIYSYLAPYVDYNCTLVEFRCGFCRSISCDGFHRHCHLPAHCYRQESEVSHIDPSIACTPA